MGNFILLTLQELIGSSDPGHFRFIVLIVPIYFNANENTSHYHAHKK